MNKQRVSKLIRLRGPFAKPCYRMTSSVMLVSCVLSSIIFESTALLPKISEFSHRHSRLSFRSKVRDLSQKLLSRWLSAGSRICAYVLSDWLTGSYSRKIKYSVTISLQFTLQRSFSSCAKSIEFFLASFDVSSCFFLQLPAETQGFSLKFEWDAPSKL